MALRSMTLQCAASSLWTLLVSEEVWRFHSSKSSLRFNHPMAYGTTPSARSSLAALQRCECRTVTTTEPKPCCAFYLPFTASKAAIVSFSSSKSSTTTPATSLAPPHQPKLI